MTRWRVHDHPWAPSHKIQLCCDWFEAAKMIRAEGRLWFEDDDGELVLVVSESELGGLERGQ